MTDRRSFDRDRRSFFRDREVIADLCFIKRSQGDRDLEIRGSRSCDLLFKQDWKYFHQ